MGDPASGHLGNRHLVGSGRRQLGLAGFVVLALGDVGVVAGTIGVIAGTYIAVHELRRRERRVTRREIDDLTEEVAALRELLLEQRRYIYKLVTLMIDAGMDPPHPPAPGFDPGEYD